MLAALALPRVLDQIPNRQVMLAGAILLVAGLLAGLAGPGLAALLPLWLVLGVGYSTVGTPMAGCCAAPRTRRIGQRCLRPSSRCRTPAGC